MKYAYIRVSSADQNLARQIKAIQEYAADIEQDHVFADKASGKNFERVEYQRMKGLLQAGDEVIIKDLDRLGRNKEGIKAELQWFKDHGATARILNVPTTLIDFKDQSWVADMVNNILVEVMGAIAEQERESIKKRQREGIDAMPVENGKRVSLRTGRCVGRPQKQISDFEKIAQKQKEGLLTVKEACGMLGISKTQWYRIVQETA